ncbi:MAG: S24 family peptidase [Thermodesulfobacteriota bacterium]|nr:S24 family peptidase [Thermodesulfobacteriota bacterium]
MSPIQKIRFDTFFIRLCDATTITSQANLAKALSVSRSAITQAKRNDSIPKKWIFVLSRLYNLNPAWLEKGTGPTFSNQNNYQEIFLQVPKVRARLSAGSGSFETEPEIEEYYSFQNDWLTKKGKSKDMVLMDIIGNSMEPELKERDTVLIDQSQKAVLAGAIYAVGLDDTIVVKRLEKRPKELVLFSENRSYPPISFRGEEMNSVRIIGKVIWICRELK